jgi:hypothetical protein
MEHQPDYPASVLGEARFCVKLNDGFDWMTVGPKYNKLYMRRSCWFVHRIALRITVEDELFVATLVPSLKVFKAGDL